MLSNDLKDNIKNAFKSAKDIIPDFKVRPAQNMMIAEVAKTLANTDDSNAILCVEAPTGTGKTMAYLLSAIPIAKANKRKLVVASANVALQEQLLYKDMVDAQRYCAIDFEYALVKGRSRYLCVRNLVNLVEKKANAPQLFNDNELWDAPPGKTQLSLLNKMLDDYSDKKWQGEIDDLEKPPEGSLWQKIACNRFTCTAKNCDFYNDCAFFKARKKISFADVIVANHDLVLADLSTGNTVLPNVEESIYIFDEAHHLNAKALSHFALSSSTEFIKTITHQCASVGEQICKITQQTPPDISIKAVDDYLDDLVQLLQDLDFDEEQHLFNQGVVDEPIHSVCGNLSVLINSIHKQFDSLKTSWVDYQKIQTIDKSITDPLNNVLGECEQHLLSIVQLFHSFLQSDSPNQMPNSRWVEKSILANKKTNYTLNSAQIDISKRLNELIWSKAAGAVLTSATLSSLGSFARLNQQLGLVKAQNHYLRLPSPFNLKAVDFIIAKFKSNPTQVYEHTQEVAAQLLKRLNPDESSLVLFASNKQMQSVADLVDEKLGCDLLVQGEFSKKLILEKHINHRKQGKGSVIFGLDSFAEGVDLKGDNLTHLVIVKLRFNVPTSPIDKTLADYLSLQNRNSFMEISLPDASLKLIQACGRLIRTETDSGKITIFDNRLITKRYGKQLLNALPDYNIIVE